MVPDSGPRSGKNAPKKGKVRKRVSAGGRERQKFVAATKRRKNGKEGAGRNVGGSRARSGDPELRGR